tara:strand:+ start:179 stop:985 length:807 start_codon:yes stop_codon:yes gene_type:complete
MNYNEQREKVLGIGVQEGQSIRMDCPFCFHNNTFSITKENSKLMWYCFSASCDAKGTMSTEKTMNDVEHFIHSKSKQVSKDFIIPRNFTSPHSDERCIKYLKNNNCFTAFTRGLVDVRYDPARDRIVFLVHDFHDKIIGGVGRSLNYSVLPKWYVYGSRECPFICGTGATIVIVEDCASACAVSEDFTGLALMGTSLTNEHTNEIQKRLRLAKNRDVIVALDRDATTKAFDIAREIGYIAQTKVIMLEDDLKYFKPDRIKEILCKNDS